MSDSAVMSASYKTMVKLKRKAKLSIYQSLYVPPLTYGHELWVMTERIIWWIQATEMGFLQRLAGLHLRGKIG